MSPRLCSLECFVFVADVVFNFYQRLTLVETSHRGNIIHVRVFEKIVEGV